MFFRYINYDFGQLHSLLSNSLIITDKEEPEIYPQIPLISEVNEYQKMMVKDIKVFIGSKEEIEKAKKILFYLTNVEYIEHPYVESGKIYEIVSDEMKYQLLYGLGGKYTKMSAEEKYVCGFNDKGNMFEFQNTFIYISSVRKRDRAICVDVKDDIESLYKLLDKVIYDSENNLIGLGGTRNIKLVSIDGKYNENNSMTIDIISKENHQIEITFTLESLEKGRQNNWCFFEVDLNKAREILGWLKLLKEKE